MLSPRSGQPSFAPCPSWSGACHSPGLAGSVGEHAASGTGRAGLALTTNATYLLGRAPATQIRVLSAGASPDQGTLAEAARGLARGGIDRPQRDASIDRLIDEFAHTAERLREQLHSEESAT